MKKEIKSGIIMAVSFLLTIGLAGITYAAFVSITEVNTTGTLTADLMNNVINNQKDLDTRIAGGGTPSGAVMAFNLALCPTGWSVADGTNSNPDLRGTFIRGMNGDVNSRDVARTLGDYQVDDYKSHSHGQKGGAYPALVSGSNNFTGTNNGVTAHTSTYNSGGSETRPKNVALLYCVKD